MLRAMKSMTGYGRGECAQDGFKVTVELSSVNRKQAEVSVTLPRELELLEAPLRDVIHRAVARGRVNARVSLHAADGKSSARKHIDVALAKAYAAELARLAKQLKLSGEVTLDQVLRAPGVFQTDEELAGIGGSLAGGGKGAEPGAGRAAENARTRRRASGEGFGAAHRRDARSRWRQIQKQAPTTAENYRQNLLERIKAAGLENIAPDDERLLKEIVLFADRSDITEELTRLQSHFHAVRRLLQIQGAGRAHAGFSGAGNEPRNQHHRLQGE